MKTLFGTIAVFAFLMLGPGEARARDIRSDLQEAASKGDPDFPDGKSVQLTHFSVTCQLKTRSGPIHVVDQRAVMTGMIAPRGQNQISFFDHHLKFIASLRYVSSRPLWCEGPKLYLFGGWDGAVFEDSRCASGRDCNVVEWLDSSKQFKLIHERKYGSSGGINDP